MQVPLGYKVVLRVEVVQVTGQEDSSSLTTGFRLHNEGTHLALLELGLEIAILGRE